MSNPNSFTKLETPKERISYETLLLIKLNDCSSLRYRVVADPNLNPEAFTTCVDTLILLLTQDLRQEVAKRLKDHEKELEEYYNEVYRELLLKGGMTSEERGKIAQIRTAFRKASILLSIIIDVLNEKGLLLHFEQLGIGVPGAP